MTIPAPSASNTSAQHASPKHTSALPFQFVISSQFPLFPEHASSEAHNGSGSPGHSLVCPVWDAGNWQLSFDRNNSNTRKENQKFKSGEGTARIAQELDLFAQALQEHAPQLKPGQLFGLVATTPAQIEAGAEFVSHFFVPGEFCRQSDVLAAAARTKAKILVERGAFLAPNDVIRAVEKLDPEKVMLVDAGSSFGYSDRVLDVRSLALLKTSGLPFGVNISALLAPTGQVSPWKGEWISDPATSQTFADAFIDASLIVGASFFVYRNEDTHVRRKLERAHY